MPILALLVALVETRRAARFAKTTLRPHYKVSVFDANNDLENAP
jgi:hypothetical protein